MLSEEFSYWQTGTVENEYKYYFTRPDPTPEFGHFSIDMTDSLQVKASFFPQSLINPIQMNQAFMALFSQATAKAGLELRQSFRPVPLCGLGYLQQESYYLQEWRPRRRRPCIDDVSLLFPADLERTASPFSTVASMTTSRSAQ